MVYFSLLALPLFGIGQMLLPGGDTDSRRAGFAFLFVYMAAAVGLLLTTSFLALRRYLRQRHLKMPGLIAFGWLKFGAGVAGLVLAAALLLPRPGVNDTWQTLRYQVDYQLHRASEYAARISPQAQAGDVRAAKRKNPANQRANSSNSISEDKAATSQQRPANPDSGRPEGEAPRAGFSARTFRPHPPGPRRGFYRWFRALFFLAGGHY